MEQFYVDGLTGCWVWTGTIDKAGYGRIGAGGRGGDGLYAHRVAHEQWVGPIPNGLVVDQTCHNGTDCHMGPLCPHRRCINPETLEAVTRSVNNLRGNGWSGQNSRKTHCPLGHALTGDNLFTDNRGQRVCRACTGAGRSRRQAACGTVSGYNAHQRRSEAVCPECRVAYRLYQRDWARRRVALR